jgi:hypothetical protein
MSKANSSRALSDRSAADYAIPTSPTVSKRRRPWFQDNRYLHGDETAITAAGVAAIQKIWDLPEAQAAFDR